MKVQECSEENKLWVGHFKYGSKTGKKHFKPTHIRAKGSADSNKSTRRTYRQKDSLYGYISLSLSLSKRKINELDEVPMA